MSPRGALILAALTAGSAVRAPAQQAVQGPIVYVVAPSPSTDKEAHRIMRFCRWNDTTVVRDADMLLVVVRSSGSTPLSSHYDSLKWLRDAASSQANESGAQFHSYLFTMHADQSLTEANHRSYDVYDGSGQLMDPRVPVNRCGFPCACF